MTPLPANLLPDLANTGFQFEFRKGSGSVGPSADSDRLYQVDNLFSLAAGDTNLTADAIDNGAPNGANYKDNGAVAFGTPRDVGIGPLTAVGTHSGTFLPNAEDDNWAMHGIGYIIVSAAQATASQANPWTFSETSDDAARMVIGANAVTVAIGDASRGNTTDTNQVIFSGPGIYPVYLSYDQGGGGSDFAFFYNVPVAGGGDGVNHVLGDTISTPAPTGINLLPVVQNVITSVTAEPTGSVGINPGDLVTFTAGTGTVNTLATANALAALPNGNPGIAARATDNGVATINYLDSPVVATKFNGPLLGPNSTTTFTYPAPRDVGTPTPLTAVSGTFAPIAADNNFVMSSSGFINITASQVGVWTFEVYGSDGEQLQIGPVGGMQTVTMADGVRLVYASPAGPGGSSSTQTPAVTGPAPDFGQVNFATPGLYRFQLTWFHNTGTGGSVQFLAKGPGQADFALVGDTAAHGNTLQVFQNEILPADVGVTMTGPASVTSGNTITYTIKVTNSGPGPAQNVKLADPLPAGTTFVSATGPAGWTLTTPAVGSGGSLSATIASLASGASGTFQLTVFVPVTTSISLLTNTATISSTRPPNDVNPANDSTTVQTTVFPPPPPPPTLPIIATGSDAGSPAIVNIYDGQSGQLKFSLVPFGPLFFGGARVAVGDVNGDGTKDVIVGAGPGGLPEVLVFDGKTGGLLEVLFAFGSQSTSSLGTAVIGGGIRGFFTGGVYVAAGDVNGDGKADIIVGADAGATPLVQVYDGASGAVLSNFFAFAPFFKGGVRVAAGDVNGDGKADIICAAGPGGGPQVTVYDGATGNVLQNFYAFAPFFSGGVYLAAGDINGDKHADIMVGAGAGAGPQVSIFDGATNNVLDNYFAYPLFFTGGVRVGAADVNGDGRADVLTSPGKGGLSQVTAFDSQTLAVLQSFFAFGLFTGGVHVGGA